MGLYHIMNLHKVLLASAALAVAVAAGAAPLDKQDEGDYVLLNLQQEPTPLQMRYLLRADGQWIMDSNTDNQGWQPVCRGDGSCRLQASREADVRQWRRLLPEQIRQYPLACINNVAFAFCRMSKPDNPKQRLYWWISLLEGQHHALGLNRIR